MSDRFLGKTSSVAAYGKTVWSWRPWLASSWRRFAKPNRAMRTVNSSATEAKRIRLRGERGIRRQTIAQGRPDALRWTCMLVCALLCARCTRDRGCSAHPVFPAPSVLEEGKLPANLGRNPCREKAKICRMLNAVIASGAKQSMVPHKGRMDCFVANAPRNDECPPLARFRCFNAHFSQPSDPARFFTDHSTSRETNSASLRSSVVAVIIMPSKQRGATWRRCERSMRPYGSWKRKA